MTVRKPRKMPKNQRAYKTPSGKKGTVLEITDSYTLRVLEAGQADIGVPKLIEGRFVDANKFRKWRIGLTAETEVKQPC